MGFNPFPENPRWKLITIGGTENTQILVVLIGGKNVRLHFDSLHLLNTFI